MPQETQESLSARPASESRMTLAKLMLPEHANAMGAVHGGTIMKMVDEAGGICAMRHARRPCVTVAIDSMTFRSKVRLGDVLSCSAEINYVGNTAIEVGVRVTAENPITGTVTHTNSAHLVFVAIDEVGKPVRVPPLQITNEQERANCEAARKRQQARIAARAKSPRT